MKGGDSITPESLKDHHGGISPEQLRQAQSQAQYKLKLLNKITRGAVPEELGQEEFAQGKESERVAKEDEALGNEVSVGGQEIQALQPFGRGHNLRYSSAVNEFSGADGQLAGGEAEAPPSAEPVNKAPSQMSQEEQDRQN